jgi:2-keto-4-pentenoate hydratase/2-oxohepta-3-ene-1,7-dioic acid hydratase in catechol pathway
MRFGVVMTRMGKVFARLDGDKAIEYSAAPWLSGEETGIVHAFSPADLSAPVQPSKILCVGRNYAAHAKEMGNEVPKEPMLFLKPPSSIIGPGDSIELPPESTRVEHEAELAMVIGKTLKRASVEEARAAIFGFTCACDVSARDLQKGDGQWWRAKGSDTFCPVGPWIETDLDPKDLSVVCRVNGVTKQDGRTSNMIFDVATFIAFASKTMTIYPGDLFLSGSPEGVGPVVDGDEVTVDIQGIGALTVRVIAEKTMSAVSVAGTKIEH